MQDVSQQPGRSSRRLWLWVVGAALILVCAVVYLAANGYLQRGLGNIVEATTHTRYYYIPSEAMLPTFEVNDHVVCDTAAYRDRLPEHGDVIVFKAPPAASADGQERDFIKRVIAVQGDEVRIEPGYVLVGHNEFKHMDLAELLSKKRWQATVRIVDGGHVLVDGRSVTAKEVAAAANEPNARVVIAPGKVYVNGKPLEEPYLNEDPDDAYPGSTMPPSDRRSYVIEDKDSKPVVKIPKGKLLALGDNRNNSRDCRYWGLLDVERVKGRVNRIVWPEGRAGAVR